MARWGMVIDLKKCIGCHTCTVACKVENMVRPNIFWNRVYDYETGEYPAVNRYFLPRLCMQCEDPACLSVCPTKATMQREDGIVYVDYNKCLGCGYCVLACPYRARSLVKKKEYYYGASTPYEEFPNELRASHQRYIAGTASKCTFCMHKIDNGIAKKLRVGIDPEATPACVLGCIARARYFGDLNDPESEVSMIIRERKGFKLLDEFGTSPSVYYLNA
jgi:phenylacetyl-CoA:acceptor oxidoreductase subunit 1